MSVFADRSAKPEILLLNKAIGDTAKFWEEIKKHITDTHGPLSEEWKFYGAKYGWTLKVLLRRRNLFFVTPLSGHFRVSFVFGDRAVAAAEKSDLPKDLIETLRNARKYAEGRGDCESIDRYQSP